MDVCIFKIFQWCIFLITIIQVICNTKSKRICQKNSYPIQVKISTGDVLYAGTDNDISLILRSANGIICQEYDLNNPGNDRERNHTDEYIICCSKAFFNDKNELSMVAFSELIRIGSRVPAIKDSWFIEHIEIRNNESILFDYRFHDWSSSTNHLLFGVTKLNNKNYLRF